MNYNFDTIPNREETSSVKFDLREDRFGRANVIPMWVADMDFAVAPCISEALKKRMEHPIYGYSIRDEQTINNIVSWVERRNGWKIEPEWLSFTPGVVPGLVFSILAFSKPGDGVVIQPPVYPPFADTVKSNERKLLTNSLILEGDSFVIDFEDLDEKLSQAEAIVLCNPHNPTGRVFTKEELLKIGELCVKHNVYIISDEIHSDLVYSPHQHIHIASLSPEIAKLTVTLIAPSKTFNIAGLSTSVAIISDEETHKKFCDMVERAHITGGNIFGNVAMKAAYGEGEAWLEQLLVYLKGNIDYVRKFIADNMPLIKTYETEGTFLMWLNFSALEMTCKELKDFIINKALLGLNDGRQFGEEGCCHMRLNVGTSRAVVEKAMNQLLTAYKSLEL